MSLTTTDRICEFLQSKLPNSVWNFHMHSIRAFIEKEVLQGQPVSLLSETPPASDAPAEHDWHDGREPPINTRDVLGEWSDGMRECWHGYVDDQWYCAKSTRSVSPPIRWRELTDEEKGATS